MPENRPSWDQYFLNIAEVVSTRSIDPSTKHGCVLVKDKHIIGTGYNGPPRGMKDSCVPSTRPEKYDWYHHAERNSLDNRTLVERGFTAYITGEPCFSCLTSLYNCGAYRIVYGNRGSNCINERDLINKQNFYDWCKSEVVLSEDHLPKSIIFIAHAKFV
jgi:dCMP deaminase